MHELNTIGDQALVIYVRYMGRLNTRNIHWEIYIIKQGAKIKHSTNWQEQKEQNTPQGNIKVTRLLTGRCWAIKTTTYRVYTVAIPCFSLP